MAFYGELFEHVLYYAKASRCYECVIECLCEKHSQQEFRNGFFSFSKEIGALSTCELPWHHPKQETPLFSRWKPLSVITFPLFNVSWNSRLSWLSDA